jgi:N-carbamoyl-L-amino-acid hydrolase
VLDQSRTAIGAVEGIVGIRSWDVTVTGFANHAGTTPMDQRKNALVAAAELVLAVDRIVRATPGRQVGTVGRLEVRPGAPNVVPGAVDLSIEIRDLSTPTLDRLWAAIRSEAEAVMARHGTEWTVRERATNQPARSDPRIRDLVEDSARGLGLTVRRLPSGAGHDAQNLARIGPMGMIFVPSVGGISHSPREFTRPEDVTHGVNALLHVMIALDQLS